MSLGWKPFHAASFGLLAFLFSSHAHSVQLQCSAPDVLRDSQSRPLPTANRSEPAIDDRWIAYIKDEPINNSYVVWTYDRQNQTENSLRFISSAYIDFKPSLNKGFLVFRSKNRGSGDVKIWLYDLQNPTRWPQELDNNNDVIQRLRVRLNDPKMDYDPIFNRLFVSWGRNFHEGAPFVPNYRSCMIDLNDPYRQTGSCFTPSGQAPAHHISRAVDMTPAWPRQVWQSVMSSDVFPLYKPGYPNAHGVAFTGSPGGYQAKPLFVSEQSGDYIWSGNLFAYWDVSDAHFGTVVVNERTSNWSHLVQLSFLTPGLTSLTPTQTGIFDSAAFYSREITQSGIQSLVWERFDRSNRSKNIAVRFLQNSSSYDTLLSPNTATTDVYIAPNVHKKTVVFERRDSSAWNATREIRISNCDLI